MNAMRRDIHSGRQARVLGFVGRQAGSGSTARVVRALPAISSIVTRLKSPRCAGEKARRSASSQGCNRSAGARVCVRARARPAIKCPSDKRRLCGAACATGGSKQRQQPPERALAPAIGPYARLADWRSALPPRPFSPYIGNAGLPAMAINGRRNKPFGPGGSTRRLHHQRSAIRTKPNALQECSDC
jgi:hypothetical protein